MGKRDDDDATSGDDYDDDVVDDDSEEDVVDDDSEEDVVDDDDSEEDVVDDDGSEEDVVDDDDDSEEDVVDDDDSEEDVVDDDDSEEDAGDDKKKAKDVDNDDKKGEEDDADEEEEEKAEAAPVHHKKKKKNGKPKVAAKAKAKATATAKTEIKDGKKAKDGKNKKSDAPMDAPGPPFDPNTSIQVPSACFVIHFRGVTVRAVELDEEMAPVVPEKYNTPSPGKKGAKLFIFPGDLAVALGQPPTAGAGFARLETTKHTRASVKLGRPSVRKMVIPPLIALKAFLSASTRGGRQKLTHKDAVAFRAALDDPKLITEIVDHQQMADYGPPVNGAPAASASASAAAAAAAAADSGAGAAAAAAPTPTRKRKPPTTNEAPASYSDGHKNSRLTLTEAMAPFADAFAAAMVPAMMKAMAEAAANN